MSHLSGGRVNIALIQEKAKQELLTLLQQCDGPKVLIWDEWLTLPVGLVAQFSLMKENEVLKMYSLESEINPPTNVKHVIFITRPKIHLMDSVAKIVFNITNANNGLKKEFHLFFVPRKSEMCENRLTYKRVLGSFTRIDEFKCDVFPFDSDLLSLELENDFRDLYLDGDTTCLYESAQALHKIQKLYGTIPKVLGKGPSAKQIWELMCRLNKEDQGTGPRGPSQGCIDMLVLLDRTIDMTTVFTTQLTYEGLIDELFGINSGTAKFPARRFLPTEQMSTKADVEKKIVMLNSGEELFVDLRDKNFTSVGPILARKARLIQDQLGEKQNNKSVQEIKQFVSRIPYMMANKQSLATHTAIAELIKEITDEFEFHDQLQCEEDFLNCVDTEKLSCYIEDLIAQQAPLKKVLRLICLQCVTGSGLKPKILDYYKKELVQVYGLDTWLGLCNLEKAGILKVQSGARQYAVLRKALRLTVDDSNDSDIQDRSYLKSTYTPLTVRLADHLSVNKGWFGLQDIIGPTIEETQSIPHIQNRRNSISSENSSITEPTRVILVFFIGGCTYTEVSGLRALSQKDESNVDFVIMTTKMINGNTFLETLMEPIQ